MATTARKAAAKTPSTKKDGTPRAPRTTSLVTDFSNLSVAKASAPIRSNTKSLLDGTPFREFVQKSYESGDSLEFRVPNEAAAKQACSLLAKAADEKNYGLRKNYRADGSEYVVAFKAQDRRKYAPRKTTK